MNSKVVTEIRVVCKECGDTFQVLSNFKGKARAYCSRQCASRRTSRKWYHVHKTEASR